MCPVWALNRSYEHKCLHNASNNYYFSGFRSMYFMLCLFDAGQNFIIYFRELCASDIGQERGREEQERC